MVTHALVKCLGRRTLPIGVSAPPLAWLRIAVMYSSRLADYAHIRPGSIRGRFALRS